MGRILRLDPLVQSQIAAGEVVERPASVVKELVENSLDAGARRIGVDFEEGGLSFIRVTDDGCGIPAEDASLALERFATSKLSSAQDLASIATLGFRGEALPSIAAVSRMTLETRARGEDAGTSVQSEEGRILAVTEKGLPIGTTVTVRDLFYNTPARLKFMKSQSTERQALTEIVIRLALAWPSVSFTLRSKENTIVETFGQGLGNALSDIFGPDDASRMVLVEHESGIRGFVSLPSLYRRTRDRQIVSVNSRPIRNTSLGWALDQAYAGLLPPKTFAIAVLDLSVPQGEIDVNVHPAKAEVKFQKDRDIRSSIMKAVGESLRQAGFALAGFETSRPATHPLPSMGGGRPRGIVETSGDINWGLVRDVPVVKDSPLSLPEPSGWEYLGSLEDTYLVARTPTSLLIVDKHALMESLAFSNLVSGTGGSQELLVSEMVRLEPQESLAYEELEAVLAEVGFTSRLVGDRTVMVTAVPLVLGRAVPPESIKEVLQRLSAETRGDPVRALSAARLETAACHASVRAREKLSADEARGLLATLRDNPSARTCPHGRPTVKEISVKELDNFFGRPSQGRRTQV